LPGHSDWLTGWVSIEVTVFAVRFNEAPEVVVQDEKPTTVKIPDVAVLLNVREALVEVDVTETPLPVYPHK
jgi:hypothetical protein